MWGGCLETVGRLSLGCLKCMGGLSGRGGDAVWMVWGGCLEVVGRLS